MIQLFNMSPWIVLVAMLLVVVVDMRMNANTLWTISRVLKIVMKMVLVSFFVSMFLFCLLWTLG